MQQAHLVLAISVLSVGQKVILMLLAVFNALRLRLEQLVLRRPCTSRSQVPLEPMLVARRRAYFLVAGAASSVPTLYIDHLLEQLSSPCGVSPSIF